MRFLGLSLPIWILISLGLGVFAGFFFGDLIVFLAPVGDAFIMLLKMSILPYITVAVIHGVGSLKTYQAIRLLKISGIFILAIWIITLATLLGMTLIFPAENPTVVYGTAQTHQAQIDAYLRLFIPDNPFHALANNIVPAVVIFSLFFGAGLMMVKREKKQQFLETLDVAVQVLAAITRWVIYISPIGIFALVASTLGSISLEQLGRLTLYLIGFTAATVFLLFWALPAMVTSMTRISYAELFRDFQPPLLLAFSTGNIFISLPYLMTALDRLSQDHAFFTDESKPVARTLVPISYDLPLVGNLMALYFVYFMGYYYAVDFTFPDQLKMMFVSLFTLAGPVTAGLNSISFLIEAFGLPTDGVSLFAETFAVTRNLQAVAGCMGIGAFTLLSLCAFTRQLHFRWSKAIINLSIAVALFVGLVFFARWLEPKPVTERPVFLSMRIENPVPYKVYRPGEPVPRAAPLSDYGSYLDRIRGTGVLRVGYNPKTMPFSYWNDYDELVGFDVALAHNLARSLNVHLEFIPFEFRDLADFIASEQVDIIMSAVSITAPRLELMAFSKPVVHVEAAFIVPDTERAEYTDSDKVKARKNLRLGVLEGSAFVHIAAEHLPNAQVVPLRSYDEGINNPNIDAMLWTNKEGLTWVLINPAYTVVIPYPAIRKGIYAFALPLEAQEFLAQVNLWLELRHLDGFIEAGEKKWIQGKVKKREPRWSIIRNVLHWVD